MPVPAYPSPTRPRSPQAPEASRRTWRHHQHRPRTTPHRHRRGTRTTTSSSSRTPAACSAIAPTPTCTPDTTRPDQRPHHHHRAVSTTPSRCPEATPAARSPRTDREQTFDNTPTALLHRGHRRRAPDNASTTQPKALSTTSMTPQTQLKICAVPGHPLNPGRRPHSAFKWPSAGRSRCPPVGRFTYLARSASW